MKITAKAPCKVIITGEHGVVHGTPAIAIPIEPLHIATLIEKKGNGIELRYYKKIVEIDESGKITSGDGLLAYLVKRMVENGLKPKGKISITIEPEVPKGVGASSSVAAVAALCLYKYLGKTPTKEELFEDVQFSDTIAHGGRPSGIDARTVVYGPTKMTRGENNWNFENVKVTLPAETTLLVINTSKDGKRSGTGEMVKKIATNLGFVKLDGAIKTLSELTAEDKEKLKPFTEVYDKIIAQLHEYGNAVLLGKAMNENHELLKKLGASTENIELARKISLDSGALGAKITGSGGEGGAVIVFVKNSYAEQVKKALEEKGFNSFEARQTKGALE